MLFRSLHLVERVVPDHLAGKPIKSFHDENDIKVVGVVRSGSGRLDVDELFSQEDDIIQCMVTTSGLAKLKAVLEGGQS